MFPSSTRACASCRPCRRRKASSLWIPGSPTAPFPDLQQYDQPDYGQQADYGQQQQGGPYGGGGGPDFYGQPDYGNLPPPQQQQQQPYGGDDPRQQSHMMDAPPQAQQMAGGDGGMGDPRHQAGLAGDPRAQQHFQGAPYSPSQQQAPPPQQQQEPPQQVPVAAQQLDPDQQKGETLEGSQLEHNLPVGCMFGIAAHPTCGLPVGYCDVMCASECKACSWLWSSAALKQKRRDWCSAPG